MLKTRIFLIVASVAVIIALFLLPKVVVENDGTVATGAQGADSVGQHADVHAAAPRAVVQSIASLRIQYQRGSEKEKNAIFADSLAGLYRIAGKFDSAAWFSEEAAKFFNTTGSWIEAGDDYYQAFGFATEEAKQNRLAGKAQELYKKVLDENPKNLDVKTKLAMTYLSSTNPMQGIMLLREVLAEDPKNELALYNMGMLSIQSGQHEKAVERLEELLKVNPNHTQGQLLLGIALMNTGDNQRAKKQFERVKEMDKDPAVQATVDSYLKDLK
ncbi:tetratricopeptide repeat protein [Dawidia cretensis]|uniref:tetratricopeptide repeat protein n=1 Tax=Dawidia cretensis TaxID=2782350 RepID=UPI0020B32AD4|nr:tetratricopeptide repeat protein [Dawidia cretensis]